MTVQRDEDGRLVISRIEDQLAWDGLDGVGLTFTVSVTLDGETVSRSGAVSLLMPPEPPNACDVFEQSDPNGSTNYYLIPGTAEVIYGEASGPCIDGRVVDLAFVPDDLEAATACAEFRYTGLQESYRFSPQGNPPSAECLELLDLTDGSTVRANLNILHRGGGNPTLLRLEADTSGCWDTCYE